MENQLKNPRPKSNKEFEKMGRVVTELLGADYFNKKNTIKRNLYIGIIRGVGAAIGATLVIALLIWVLTLFGEIPLLRPIVHEVQDVLKTQQ